MTAFKLDLNAETCGTSRQSQVDASYSELFNLFGEPLDSDGYKVSGEWSFTDSDGNVVTVYDWKSTNLYDEYYPSVEEFRASSRVTFNIGAHSREVASNFLSWLNTQLKG